MLNTMQSYVFKFERQKNLLTQFLNSCKEYCTAINSNVKDDRVTEILKVLNTSTAKQLTRYIDKSMAESLVLHRKKIGQYKSMDDVSESKIESGALQELCYSIICHKEQKANLKKSVVTPVITNIWVPENVIGIHVGRNAVAWTSVDCNSKLLDWDCFTLHNEDAKFKMYDEINLIASVVNGIPKATYYVMEEVKVIKKTAGPKTFQQQYLGVSIMSCLKLREQQDIKDSLPSSNSFYILQPLTSARCFNLVLGTELISTKHITNEILKNSEEYNGSEDSCINSELRQKYTKRQDYEKEQMGWSLLKGLTFIRLMEILNVNMPLRRNFEKTFNKER